MLRVAVFVLNEPKVGVFSVITIPMSISFISITTYACRRQVRVSSAVSEKTNLIKSLAALDCKKMAKNIVSEKEIAPCEILSPKKTQC